MTKHHNAQSARPHSPTQQSKPKPLEGAFNLLMPDIQRALTAEGYHQPTPIQEQCIQHLLNKRDLLGTAQTGTGKTAAFTLPLLERLCDDMRRPLDCTPRALILAPTRELAAQIGDSIEAYGKFLDLDHTVVFGGVSQHRQVNALKRGVDILVATPGRLLDLMDQGFIHLDQVEFFILDEVDRMLDMGFIPAIRQVLAKLPTERQTLFFSATMPTSMQNLAGSMLKNPVRVTITPDEPAVDRIAQKVLFVGKQHKDALLASLLGDRDVSKAIVFTQMKHVANRVVQKLAGAGIEGAAIHGNKSQAARTKALDGFKRGRFRVLVATDVAARGIDIDDITHVINYDLPVEAETYVHRIGRTARAGAEGDAISFCSGEEKDQLNDIERLLGRTVPQDTDHDYHCEATFRSDRSVPKKKSANRGGGRGGSRPRGRGQNNRNRSRRRQHS